jgi:hypothetical protein
MDNIMDGWIWMDGWMDGYGCGWMDGWMDVDGWGSLQVKNVTARNVLHHGPKAILTIPEHEI